MKQSVAFQRVWAGMLVLMGIALFFRIPVVMENLAGSGAVSSGAVFFRFCMYFIAIFLVAGGVKKWISSTRKEE